MTFVPTPSFPPESSPRSSPAEFAVRLVLVSLGALFGATVIAYWVTRANVKEWMDVELSLPIGLFASTLMLIGVSGSFEWALRGIRRNRQAALRQGLWLGSAFSLAFLVGQSFNWFDVLRLNPDVADRDLALFTFYMLTGVHALHVVGGFVPLAYVLHRAYQREYSSSRYEGVKLCVLYWHFLGVVWLGLLAVMYWV